MNTLPSEFVLDVQKSQELFKTCVDWGAKSGTRAADFPIYLLSVLAVVYAKETNCKGLVADSHEILTSLCEQMRNAWTECKLLQDEPND